MAQIMAITGRVRGKIQKRADEYSKKPSIVISVEVKEQLNPRISDIGHLKYQY
jgi:hypothetical protein